MAEDQQPIRHDVVREVAGRLTGYSADYYGPEPDLNEAELAEVARRRAKDLERLRLRGY